MYLYCDQSKSRGKDRYLVTSTDDAWCQVTKLVRSQLRSTTFRIRKAEFYKVPMNASPSLPHHMSSAWFDTDDDDDTLLPPASPPQVPTAPPTPTSQLYQTTDALPPRTPPLMLFLHLLLIPIKIVTLYPYRLPANSQAKAWYPNGQQVPAVLHSTPYKTRRKETVAPLGTICCFTLLYCY